MQQVNLAVIGFDSMHLLIPQNSVATIEMIDSMEFGGGENGAAGKLRAAGREYPVYVLNARLESLSERSAAHKYCVAFNLDDQPAFAIACDEVRSLTRHAADEVKELPACMHIPGSPVEAMLLRDDRLMLFSQAASMLRFLTMDAAA